MTEDITPPQISNVEASTLDKSALITWDTDESSTTQVFYGVSPDLSDSTTETIDYVTVHGVSLTGLIPDTTYVYFVKSRDESGNETTSDVFIFKTLASEEVKKLYLPIIVK